MKFLVLLSGLVSRSVLHMGLTSLHLFPLDGLVQEKLIMSNVTKLIYNNIYAKPNALFTYNFYRYQWLMETEVMEVLPHWMFKV